MVFCLLHYLLLSAAKPSQWRQVQAPHHPFSLFSSLVKAPQPWPRPSWALRPARAMLTCHPSTPRCQAGRLLHVELPEPSIARHHHLSELSSRRRSKPSSTAMRPSPELIAVSSLHAMHRPISESFVSTLSSALSAKLASTELLHAPRGQTAAAAAHPQCVCGNARTAPRPGALL
jgi:hypothetical protein